MGVISGKDGDLKIGTEQLPEIHEWSFKPQVSAPEYASNKTAGAKKTIAGVKSGTGSVGAYFDPEDLLTDFLEVGTFATLKGYVTSTQFYSIPALVVSYNLTVNIDAGEIQKWSFEYKTNGVWTNPTEALRYGYTDLRNPDWKGNAFGNLFCPQLLPRYADEPYDDYLDRIAQYQITVAKVSPNREIAAQLFNDIRLNVQSPQFDDQLFDSVMNYIIKNSIEMDQVTLDRVDEYYRQYASAIG